MRKRTVPEFGRVTRGQTLVKGDDCNGGCGQKLIVVGGATMCIRCDGVPNVTGPKITRPDGSTKGHDA